MHEPDFSAGPRYELLRPLGEGGMGEVWVARDRLLGRLVALKRIRSEAPGPDRERKRRMFHREARVVASLAHPNIVPVFDTSAPDADDAFLVMELVDGLSLARVLEVHGALSSAATARVIAGVCAALSHAHARGVIHRDLKPANVMLERSGRVRLLDFGIARLQSALAGAALGPSTTTEGAVRGTLVYMSPEQLTGASLDHRSDLFSLGVVAYELCTGARPFADRTPGQVVAAILSGAYDPPRARRPDLHPALEALVAACLQVDRDARPSTAAGAVAMLAPLLRGDDGEGTLARLASDGDATTGGSRPPDPTEETAAVEAPSPRLAETSLTREATVRPGSASPAPAARVARSTRLVGRDPELAWLERIAHAARTKGEGGIVLLTGAAGVGKSALAGRLKELVAEGGSARTCVGWYPRSGGRPLAGILGALEDLLGVAQVERSATRDALARLVTDDGLADPEVIEPITDLLRPRGPAEGSLHPSSPGSADVVHGMLVRLLLRLAARTPLLVLLEDLSYACEATGAWLVRLSQALVVRPVPLIVCGTLEPDALSGNDALTRALAEVERAGPRLVHRRALGPLDDDAITALVGDVLPLSPDLRARVVSLVGGSPLVAERTVQHLEDSDLLEWSGWDFRLREGAPSSALISRGPAELAWMRLCAIGRRSDVPEAFEPVLKLCALIGARVPVDLLWKLTEDVHPDLLSALDGVLDALVMEGVLVEQPSGADEVLAFSSGLSREVALQRLAGGRADRALQRAIGEAKEARAAGRPGPLAPEIAQHFLSARLPARALPHLVEAGRTAHTAWSLAEAAAWYQRALGILDGGQQSDVATDVGLWLAEVELARGRMDESERVITRLLRDAADRGDQATEARCISVEAAIHESRGSYGPALDAARRAGKLAAQAGRADVELSARLLEGRTLERLGRLDEAHAVYTPLLDELRRRGDRFGTGRCLGLLATLEMRRGALDAAARHLEEAGRIHSESGDRMELARTRHNQALVSSLAGDVAGALVRIRDARDLSAELGWARGVEHCLRAHGDLLVRTGAFDDALEPYERALHLAEVAGRRDSVAHCHANRAWALLYLGRTEEAGTAAAAGLALGEQLGSVRVVVSCRVVLGEAARMEGQPQAEELLTAAVDEAQRLGIRSDSVGEALAGLARLRIEEDRPDEADALLREAAEILRENGRTADAQRLEALLGG